MAIYYTGILVGNQVNFTTGEATTVAADVKQYIINQSVTGGETGLAPSNKAVYDFGTGMSGYLYTNAGGLYQFSALSSGTDVAAINLTGRVSGQSFIDSITISGGAALDLSVANDAIVLSHTDTSSVADLTINSVAGSAVTGIAFTYDTFGHVLTATGTTAVIVRNQIQSGVTTTAPSEAAVHTLSGYLITNAGGVYQISSQSPSANVAQINLTGTVSGASFNDFVTVSGLSGVSVSVSNDVISLSHTDTSSVANLTVNAAAGSAITGIAFTYDTYGHVLTAAATSSVLVQDFIVSGVTTTAPSQNAVYGLSGYLNANAGGVYQISSQSPGTNVAQINLTGTVSGASFNDFIRISGVTGIDISVSNDIISVSHNDTSSVANASISANAGSAITGVSFTFDNFGHVLTATGTSAVIVRDQIVSGVTTTAPSENAVYGLSGMLRPLIDQALGRDLQSVTNSGSTTTNSISIGGDLLVSGNTTLGSDSSDSLTVKAGPVILEAATTASDALIFGLNDANKVSIYKSDPAVLRIEGGLIITGNLTVQGTTTTVESNVVLIGDNIITLNADFTGSVPSENAGVEIERGTQTNTALLWNEGTDRWTFSNDGSTYYNMPITSEYAMYDLTVAAGGANDAIIRITGSNGDVNDITISGSSGILVTDNSSNLIVVSHQDTSSAGNVVSTNTLGVVIQNFTGLVDTYGHVTGLGVQTTDLDVLYPRTGQVTLNYATTNGASTANDIVIGGLTVSGSAQAKSDHFVVYCSTTDATVTEMFLNGTNGRITLPTNSAASFKGQITAFDTTNQKAASWHYDCLIANKTGNSAIVGNAFVTKIGDDSGNVWEVYVDADNPNDSLKLQVKGQASATIKWTASVISTVVV